MFIQYLRTVFPWLETHVFSLFGIDSINRLIVSKDKLFQTSRITSLSCSMLVLYGAKKIQKKTTMIKRSLTYEKQSVQAHTSQYKV